MHIIFTASIHKSSSEEGGIEAKNTNEDDTGMIRRKDFE